MNLLSEAYQTAVSEPFNSPYCYSWFRQEYEKKFVGREGNMALIAKR